MDNELLEELRKIRGEVVKMRNDVLISQHVLNILEKKVDKLLAADKQPQTTPTEISQIFGAGTRVEKL
jgi:hypothetical protein